MPHLIAKTLEDLIRNNSQSNVFRSELGLQITASNGQESDIYPTPILKYSNQRGGDIPRIEDTLNHHYPIWPIYLRIRMTCSREFQWNWFERLLWNKCIVLFGSIRI